MFRSSLLFLGFVLTQVSCLRLPKNYDAIILSLTSHPEENGHVVDMSHIRVLGHEHAVNGTMIFSEDLDDTYEVYMESFVDANGNGEYKQLPLKIWPVPICKGMKDYIKKYTYPSLRPGDNTDFPFDGSECPIRKGTYYITNMLVDPTPFPDIMPRGIIKAMFYVKRGDQKLGNIELKGQVTDKIF